MMDIDSGSRYSQGSSRFRESTHLIPPADSGGKRAKRYDPWILSLPVIIGTPLLVLGLGVALEVALKVSYDRGGFRVPPKNLVEFVSTQFLLSFFPTIIVAPFAFLLRELDWMFRWYQPYIVLWKGNATAEEGLLLNYSALGPLLAIFRALKYKHRIIFWSSLVATVTYIFQPLAGSIFQIRQGYKVTYSTVNSTKAIGLAPDVNDLSAFVAAAGFTEAAVFHDLPDPPFISKGWATAEFSFPTNSGLNGTMWVNTTGIQTDVHCDNPVRQSLLDNQDNTFNLTSTSLDDCTHTVSFDPRVSTQQYGVDNVPCPSDVANFNVSLQPVMFWFFHEKADGTPEAKTVFCAPTIKAFNVEASANLEDGSLNPVNILSDYVPTNNVTGGDLSGKAYNGVIFPNISNPFINARALATRSGVSGAIFRFASQQENGPQSTFDLANGFLDITRSVYTQHLAVTAQSIYFVNSNSTLPARMSFLVPVLWIDPMPAHFLSVLLILSGLIGIVIQILHRRDQQKLLLAAPPGSIAAIASLTSRSGFGDLLLPYDDEKTIERKLDGLRFRLDRRTGAILADDAGTERADMGPDDAMLSLLGKGHQRDTASSSHSSYTAYQAAAGYPPWEQPLRIPYDR